MPSMRHVVQEISEADQPLTGEELEGVLIARRCYSALLRGLMVFYFWERVCAQKRFRYKSSTYKPNGRRRDDDYAMLFRTFAV